MHCARIFAALVPKSAASMSMNIAPGASKRASDVQQHALSMHLNGTLSDRTPRSIEMLWVYELRSGLRFRHRRQSGRDAPSFARKTF